jgi:hypothetical protein
MFQQLARQKTEDRMNRRQTVIPEKIVMQIATSGPLRLQKVKVPIKANDLRLENRILEQTEAISIKGLTYQGFGRLKHPNVLLKEFVFRGEEPLPLPTSDGHSQLSQHVKRIV